MKMRKINGRRGEERERKGLSYRTQLTAYKNSPIKVGLKREKNEEKLEMVLIVYFWV
jgi:hypothetical protein